ncbi:MAG: 30S ribosomal protein S17 [Enterobacteriaceae bacterium PSpicST2]|nr:MAG: 30S ribosomal protein S17 [Enterobacteriaceae bacterium PSpicST2]WMC18978.1 MAG: 30S ribosomal protein S17 [Enterobacteriaceae bacterium PSpicST1]
MKKKKILKGTVISNKMVKSVIVTIEYKIKHILYRKFIKKTTKFYVHDENNKCNIGDIIEFKETNPISKKKFWILLRILKKSNYLK